MLMQKHEGEAKAALKASTLVEVINCRIKLGIFIITTHLSSLESGWDHIIQTINKSQADGALI